MEDIFPASKVRDFDLKLPGENRLLVPGVLVDDIDSNISDC